ncbi:MAG: hypothetical protein HY812_19060 [Planctomycetes bacterium]|nr:hypothetical protein [Planctomycetota bacterium]
MSHLEDLVHEFYEWQGYIVRRNIRVGRLTHGGWTMELDIIAFHPHEKRVVHLEPSLDSDSWAVQERMFKKKFDAGRMCIFADVLPWLDPATPLEQIAILVSHPRRRAAMAGGRLISVDEFVRDVRKKVRAEGKAESRAISERYPLLRMMQLTHSGYHRALWRAEPRRRA